MQEGSRGRHPLPTISTRSSVPQVTQSRHPPATRGSHAPRASTTSGVRENRGGGRVTARDPAARGYRTGERPPPTNCLRKSKMFSSRNFSSRRLRCAASPRSSPARGATVPAAPEQRSAPRTSSSWRCRRYPSSASPASVASWRSRVRCRSVSASPLSRQRPSGSAPRPGVSGSGSRAPSGFMTPRETRPARAQQLALGSQASTHAAARTRVPRRSSLQPRS